jgi:hypothetical protein
MKAKKWVLVKHFDGEPKESDLELVDEDLPDELKENGFLKISIFFLKSIFFKILILISLIKKKKYSWRLFIYLWTRI